MPKWLKFLSILIILMTTLVVPLVLLEDESNALLGTLISWAEDDPWPVAIIVTLALTSDVLFPVPNGVINTLAGSLFGWALGAIVIWSGLMLGCLLGYGVGAAAGKPLTKKFIGEADLERAREFAGRMGAFTLVITRTVPMFGDIATMAAGITSYPFRKYLLVTALANIGVAIVFAGIGAQARATDSEWLAFLGAIAIPLVAWCGFKGYEKLSSG